MISTLISSGSRYSISRIKVKEKITQILGRVGLDDVEVSVSIVGDRKIRALNREYRKIDETTDVLSFPLEEPRDQDGILRLGDIVISYPQARKWAGERNKLVSEIISELVEHGLMHLLGFEYDNSSKFKISTAKNFSAGSAGSSGKS